MLAIREKNIERNDKFLESLGLINSSVATESVKTIETKQKADISNDLISSFSRTRDDLFECFPYRQKQIDFIYRYLEMETFYPPSLLLSGPQGCGKFVIACNIIQQYVGDNAIVVKIECTEYSDDNTFFTALWQSLMRAISVSQIIIKSTEFKQKSDFISNLGRMKSPRNFNDFVQMTGPVLSELELLQSSFLSNLNINNARSSSNKSSSSRSSSRDTTTCNTVTFDNIKIFMMLRNVDRLDYLEKSLCSKVLDLSKLCFRGIRVIATLTTGRSCLTLNSQSYLLLQFPPYNKAEITMILKKKVHQYLVSSSSTTSSVVCTHACLAETGLVQSSSSTSSVDIRSVAESLLVSTAATKRDPLLEKDRIYSFIDQSLEGFLVYTTHIEMLYNFIWTAWRMHVSSTTTSNFVSTATTTSSTAGVAGGVGVVKGSSSKSSAASALSAVDATRRLLGQGSGVRFYTYENNHSHSHSHSNQDMTTPTADTNDNAANADGAVAGGVNTVSALIPAMRKEVAPGLIGTATAITDGRALWLRQMSLSTKYLIVASFIAGSNSKQSDGHVFGMSTRGRRKKLKREHVNNRHKLSVDDNDTAAGSEHAGLTITASDDTSSKTSHHFAVEAIDTRYYSTPRSFNLERIFGIFFQIACHCGSSALSASELASLSLSKSTGGMSTKMEVETISRSFGTAQLFSNVKSLVNQKLLIPIRSSTLSDPCYQSNIPRYLAESIASSVKFPLQDFICHDDE